jgi:hypothetical protein
VQDPLVHWSEALQLAPSASVGTQVPVLEPEGIEQ